MAILIALPGVARACIAFTAETGLIGVNHEDAVIIWDSAHQTEHFIRSVTLNSKAKDAGFLVPTPTTPQLATADMRIFDLMEWYLPEPNSANTDSKAIGSSTNSVGIEPRVVSEQDVGDYHAVVLDASDAKGLGDWLKANAYPWSETSAKWLKPYLAAKWKITAFKFRRGGAGRASALPTSAIRMSFQTARPFFPYREPAAAGKLSSDGRVLNIAFLGDQRVIGKLGDGSNWPAQLVYAGSSTPHFAPDVKTRWLKYAKLSGVKLPAKLSYFSDYSNPRPGSADLYFSASRDQSDVP